MAKPEIISALLIVDPESGTLPKKLKDICGKFNSSNGISVTVRERAGTSVRSDCKSKILKFQVLQSFVMKPMTIFNSLLQR